MTCNTETTKRELFRFVEHVKAAMRAGEMPLASFPSLEDALESHLEALRQERDKLRNRLPAFEHANSEGKGANDRVEIQKVLIAQQRVAIGQMYMNKRVMSGQILKLAADNELLRKAARIAGEELQSARAPCANTMTILGAVIDCQQVVSDWAVYGHKAKGQMKKLAYLLNDNPELREAMKAFEKAPSCAHSFHPAFPGGERCVFCGEKRLPEEACAHDFFSNGGCPECGITA